MIGDELAKDLDALIAEAKAQPPVTAPTQGLSPAERRVGEEQLIAAASRQWWGLADDLIRDLARDLLDERAANARLTAEVERLSGIELKYRKSLWMGHGHDHLYGDDGEMQCTQCPGEAWDYRRAPLEVIERAAWLARVASLPTPGANGAPPEAGTCPECNGPVYHRDGKPGEFDHECSAPPGAATAPPEARNEK